MRDVRGVVGLAIVASLVGGTGCNKIKEKIAEKVSEKVVEKVVESQTGGKVDIDTSTGTVKVKDTKNGTTAEWGTQAKLPENWPSDVPVYPGAAIRMSASNGDGFMLSLETPDSVDKASAFYKGKMSAFKKEAEMDTGAAKTISYANGKRKVVVMVSGADENDSTKATTIQLHVGSES